MSTTAQPPATEPLLDGTSISPEWGASSLTTAVWPVGAFEQHGARLPLCTDTVLAGHFAAALARQLPAALLPVLPYASSTEHTGFRGSVSLRPETLMQIVRDLADSLERQRFTRLIIVNGHGGNFFLGPVVRDINSRDRPLKILLVDCGREFDTSSAQGKYREGELHAGASEISRMLALRPELVREAAPARQPVETSSPPRPGFLRADLNTFGIAYRHADGVWGDATGGDVESGRAMVASIEANLLAHVRERLAWLADDPRYGGAAEEGSIQLRPFRPADIEAGLELCRAAGWNQLRADWEFFLNLRPEGCFVAVLGEQVVGTVTTAAFEARHGRIAMLLVDPAQRRKGIGRMLLRAALRSLEDCRCISLEATDAGRPLYQSEGFVETLFTERWIRPASEIPCSASETGVRPMTKRDLLAVAALDAAAFGCRRSDLVEGFFAMAPGCAQVYEGPQGIDGFVLGREGCNGLHLGPVVAGNSRAAMELVHAAARSTARLPVILDAVACPEWVDRLSKEGFRRERDFHRMVLGDAAEAALGGTVYAISGPELG